MEKGDTRHTAFIVMGRVKNASALTHKAAYTIGIVAQPGVVIIIWKKAREFDMMYASESGFVKDFAERTKHNCEAMKEGPYEITQLINSMVGLLIIPKEKYHDKITDKLISDELLMEIKKCVSINTYYKEECNLKNIAKHMRNAVAHSRLEFKAEKNSINSQPLQIKAVKFMDERERENNVKYDFEIEIPIDVLRKFLYAFADAASEIVITKEEKN